MNETTDTLKVGDGFPHSMAESATLCKCELQAEGYGAKIVDRGPKHRLYRYRVEITAVPEEEL